MIFHYEVGESVQCEKSGQVGIGTILERRWAENKKGIHIEYTVNLGSEKMMFNQDELDRYSEKLFPTLRKQYGIELEKGALTPNDPYYFKTFNQGKNKT